MKTLLRLFALLLLPWVAGAAPKPLWLACGPEGLLKALEPLAELRRAQGMEAVLSALPPRAALNAVARQPDFFLIVGDDDPQAQAWSDWEVPSARVPFHRWNEKQRQDFASDFAIPGLDRLGVPLVAVGRLPVRTFAEATLVVGKILAWEKQPVTRACLGLPMWAGDPVYDPKFTEMFMGFFFAQIGKNSPPWLEPWILSGDQTHPLCGWPATQARAFDERTAQGGLFIGMMGHGGRGLFCSVPKFGGWNGYFNTDARALTQGPVRPPQIIFACQCGEFDAHAGRCLAEELLLAPAGPVLTVAATIESHPLTNFYSATNLLRLLRNVDGAVPFGTLWLQTQHAMRKRTDLLMESLLKGVEGSYSAPTDPKELKTDQATMYAILGDPATRLHAPRKLEVAMEKTARGWAWTVTPPAGATRLAVEYRNPEPPFAPRPAGVDEKTSGELLAQANAALAFRPLPAEGWHGETEQRGLLRFITETPDGIWVAGAELK